MVKEKVKKKKYYFDSKIHQDIPKIWRDKNI